MSRATEIALAEGMFDLLSPKTGPIEIQGIAERLAKINRFSGATELPWSVAQHSTVGAACWLRLWPADVEGALAFLMHDAHEAFMGDITSPVLAALCETANREYMGKQGYSAGTIVRDAVKGLKLSLDAAIAARLGTPDPSGQRFRERIAEMDQRLLRWEFNLISGCQLGGDLPAPVTGTRPQGWPAAAVLWRDRFIELRRQVSLKIVRQSA